jgi:hypothetical protein
MTFALALALVLAVVAVQVAGTIATRRRASRRLVKSRELQRALRQNQDLLLERRSVAAPPGGGPVEFAALWDATFDSIYYLALRLVGNRSLTEDIVVESYVDLLHETGLEIQIERAEARLRKLAVDHAMQAVQGRRTSGDAIEAVEAMLKQRVMAALGGNRTG